MIIIITHEVMGNEPYLVMGKGDVNNDLTHQISKLQTSNYKYLYINIYIAMSYSINSCIVCSYVGT